ncbi:MAG: ABC transporter ATP-binding protein [Phycisphaeraceae bacterium]
MSSTLEQPRASRHAVGVRLCGVTRVFAGGVHAVDAMDLAIMPGEFVALLGPSGCGKSTLLRLIAGLDRADAGRMELINASGDRAMQMAYVFQDAHLLPWRSVLCNVELPLELAGVARAERRQRALALIEQVGLRDAVQRYPAQLSGGMRMRVSLARALVTEPSLLLLDEPFAALDEITRQQLDSQLRQLWLDRGMTVIFVTHSTNEAVFLADRAVVFSARPARIVLDCALDLPAQRAQHTRTSPPFVAAMRRLYEALEAGGAS